MLSSITQLLDVGHIIAHFFVLLSAVCNASTQYLHGFCTDKKWRITNFCMTSKISLVLEYEKLYSEAQ